MHEPLKQTKPTSGRTVYFLPGQLYLLVEHPSGLDIEELVQRVEKSSLVREMPELANAVIDLERTLTFDSKHLPELFVREAGEEQGAGNKNRRRILPPNRAGQVWAMDEQLRPTQDAFSLLMFLLPTRGENAARERQLIEIVDQLNARIIRGQLAPDNGLLFRAASPNWLCTPGPDYGGGSGPGGTPMRYTGDTTNPLYQFKLKDLEHLGDQNNRSDVEVAILDSAPSCRSLVAAYNTWGQQHELLRSLVAPGGAYGTGNALEVIYASELGASLPGVNELRVKDHNYPMTDHGLFAAGIIRSIAPHAKIRLLEVLNAYGVGTLSSIGQGLLWLAEERAKQERPHPLIINMSLMIVTPLKGHSTKGLRDTWGLFADPGLLADPRMRVLTLSLEWICAMLRRQNVLIVASAGNDGDDPDAWETQKLHGARRRTRPQARYPAAFPTVLGVGALNENSAEATVYSNMADQPNGTGIATFGGSKEPSGETKQESGVLGVYIGDLPTPDSASDSYFLEANTNGWAWWAGTSFSAPIITGALAALSAQNGSLEIAEQALVAAAGAPLPSFPVGGVIPAQQGLTPTP